MRQRPSATAARRAGFGASRWVRARLREGQALAAMAPPRRAGLRASVCAALLATGAGLRLPDFVTDAAAKLIAAAGERAASAAAGASGGSAPHGGPASYPSELVEMSGHTRPELVKSALPHTYLTQQDIPAAWNWGDVNGVSFLTRALNQHVPQCAPPAPRAARAGALRSLRASRHAKTRLIGFSPRHH